jgi:hypothetical protein
MKLLVLSLTTYGKRIYTVELVIRSLMSQTLRADKIILWLDELEFTADNIPLDLAELEGEQFSIQYCPDFKSYKKLVPSLQQFPDSVIITFDDDLIYAPNLVQDLFSAHQKMPNAVVASRGRIINVDENKSISPYNQWQFIQNDQAAISADYCLLPVGYGGVLYPPHSLHAKTTDSLLFMHLAPSADDIWFKCMAMLMDTPTIILPLKCSSKLQTVENSQEESLSQAVNVGNRNGEQLTSVISTFSQLREIFTSSEFGKIEVDASMLIQLLKRNNIGKVALTKGDLFRDSAIQLEKIDLAKSLELMSMAEILKPRGPLIKKKVNLYKEKLKSLAKQE